MDTDEDSDLESDYEAEADFILENLFGGLDDTDNDEIEEESGE